MDEKETNNKKVSKFGPKLEHEHKELIITRLAEFVSWDKILEELHEGYNIEITEHTINYYSRKKEEIRAKREYLNTHLEDHIPLANKTLRVQMLERDLKRLEGATDLDTLKVKREYLEQIRKEKEGLRVDVTKRETWTPDQFKHLKDTKDLDRAIKEAEKKDGAAKDEAVTQVLLEDKT